ncbi:hypothetical protein [Rubrivirga sp. IMCC43871]|uniref:hypothetical protein n=1 Tax=Rubrivirga sp. IMCC43871 TaxID=3391575 RepID=UPI00398FFDAE
MQTPAPRDLTRLTRFVATGAVVATVAIVFATAGDRPWQSVAAVVMIALLPYVAFVALARWVSGVLVAEAVVLGGLVLAVFFAVGLYALAFVIAPGPKSASAALGVPLFQSVAVGVAGAVAGLIRLQATRADSVPSSAPPRRP